MEIKNYIKLQNRIPFRSRYIYLDVGEYYADQLFIKHEVRVKFGYELCHPDYPYLFVDCKFWSKDEDKFLSALNDLPNKMLLCGYKDYVEACEGTIGEIDKYISSVV